VGLPHPVLGQAIVVVATAADGGQLDAEALLAQCRQRLPAFMVPARVIPHDGQLPRNPNGKIDR
jgi:acyl-CoA synthetase (AMP-forming)/AMP-acid ligase II